MDVYIKAHISYMAKIGQSDTPAFMVAVCENEDHIGEPHLKIYNNVTFLSATHVTRLSLRDGHRIICENHDCKQEWNIDNETLKALNRFLDEKSRNYKGYTNWQALMFQWNWESSIISGELDDKYDTYIEAFIDGCYDTETNLSNPNYVSSDSKRPDFANSEPMTFNSSDDLLDSLERVASTPGSHSISDVIAFLERNGINDY